MWSARSRLARPVVAGLALAVLILPQASSAARRPLPSLEIRGTSPVVKGDNEVFHVTAWNRGKSAVPASLVIVTPAPLPIVQAITAGKPFKPAARHRLEATIARLAPGANRDYLIVFAVHGTAGSRPCLTAIVTVGDAAPAKAQLCLQVVARNS